MKYERNTNRESATSEIHVMGSTRVKNFTDTQSTPQQCYKVEDFPSQTSLWLHTDTGCREHLQPTSHLQNQCPLMTTEMT